MAKQRMALGLGGFFDAASEAYGEGREEWSKQFRETRKDQGKTEDAPRATEMGGSYVTGIRAAEAGKDLLAALGIRKLSKNDEVARTIREDLGIGAKKGFMPRAGQLVGTIGADLTQDHTRSIYWLLNAAQATGGVIAESTFGMANPALYGKTDLGRYKDVKSNTKYFDKNGNPRKGVSVDKDGRASVRNFEPGHKASLLIPTGIAINSGLGLMTPFGGAEGYKAAAPDQEDPTKTANVLQEVGQKYLFGNTGKLLPYSEFSKVRPDVSPEEYKQYQQFKYDKEMDLNPFDDGRFTAPGGIVKTTDEGIHGAEIQILGRSLPVTTGLVPFATSLVGGAAGVRTKMPIRGGVAGGMAGLAVGQIAGNLLEQERRRRNTVENQLDDPQF